jgi:hypothetical protein
MNYRDRVLDRVVQFDEKSRAYPAVQGITATTLRSYTWSCDVYNDQGYEGACVGFAFSHELSARPKVVRKYADYALNVYYRARQAVQETLNSYGEPLIKEYRWAFGTQDVLKVLGYRGPVVLGIYWYENMYDPDEKGFVHASGPVVGGHAILANGVKIVRLNPELPATFSNVDLDKSYVRLHNSWGMGYGIGGDAFVTVRDLDILLQNDGEAVIPTLRSVA